jgi:hypothetical protein
VSDYGINKAFIPYRVMMRESYEGFDDIFGDGEIYDGADIC